MLRNPESVRYSIGILAASFTALQSLGLVNQLLMAWSEGAAGLSLSLFVFSATGMALWATWAYLRPEHPEFLILLPNASGALVALAICATILADRHAPKVADELEQPSVLSSPALGAISTDARIDCRLEQRREAEFFGPSDDVQYRPATLTTMTSTRALQTPLVIQPLQFRTLHPFLSLCDSYAPP